MTNDRKGGIALIAGSVGFIVTMAVHPTAGGSLTTEQVVRLSQMSGVAHSLGIASTIFLFLGACALAQRLRGETCSFAALVTFGFACVSILIATSVSGFVIPAILKRMAYDEAANTHQWQNLIWGIFQINQTCARVYSVLASVAIILWSVAAWRNGGLSRGIAIYGCVIAALIIVAVASGHVRMDVHGMAAIGLGQTIWFILVGSRMSSREAVK
ncbi:MAG: hypothetical protein WAN65_17130 [Candidatus Sulfotelmatobacter sp.]